MIVFHVVFWTAFKDRCYKSNFQAGRYDPCCGEKIDDVCQGLCDYDSNIFKKTRRKAVRSGGLFTLKFLQLHKYLRDSDGYQFKSKFGFCFGLYGVDQMKYLNLIDFSFKAPAIFLKEWTKSASNWFLGGCTFDIDVEWSGRWLLGFGWKNSFDHFP